MSVYVDGLVRIAAKSSKQAARVSQANGHRWCHMVADTHAELRLFAARLGMKMAWLQKEGTEHEHFDLTPRRRAAAIRLGALEIDRRQMVELFDRKRIAAGRKPLFQDQPLGAAHG